MLTDIEPRVKTRVQQLIEQVGEDEFRRGVARFTRWHIDSMTLDEVIGLYVMARRGRLHPPERTHRALALLPTLPGRTDDDGFRHRDGQSITVEQYVEMRTALRAGLAQA